MTSIFVAKLDFGVDDQQLKSLFETYGKVNKASVALDRETGKSRGFGFVEMSNSEEAKNAIENLDGSEINGRPIAVKEAEDRAKPRPARPSGDFPRRDLRTPSSGGAAAPTRDSRFKDNDGDATAPFAADPSKEVRKKVSKEKKRELPEGPKQKKMEAYRKSGKDNRFLGDDDDDDFDEDFDLFGRDEDEDLDEDYSKYIANSNDDDDFDEDYDEDEDIEDEDEDAG